MQGAPPFSRVFASSLNVAVLPFVASFCMAAVLSAAAANALVADYHVALWTSVLLIAVLFAVVYFVRAAPAVNLRGCLTARRARGRFAGAP